MKFGPVPVSEAQGAVLAHAVVANGTRLSKGRRLSQADVDALSSSGADEVIVACLDPGDLDEDEAAASISRALISRGVETRPPGTGRVNIHALADGVFRVDRSLIDAINAVDPAVTVATLREFAPVSAGSMVATVKIIPFAVAGAVVERVRVLAQEREAFAIQPYRAWNVALIQTTLPGVKASVLDKTARITGERLRRSSSYIVGEVRVPHAVEPLSEAIAAMGGAADMIIAFGASAVSDEDDVIPAAIRAAGGEVLRTGMPVDPGNLLVLGRLGDKPVLGAPGCARSPKENGFDWVLDRLTAGIDVTDRDIAGMGVGGLLMEIATRPQPREAEPAKRAPKVHALVLAAGRSSRMGGPNKLLASFEDVPLVRRIAVAVLASGVEGVVVVTGHQAGRVRAALDGLALHVVDNAAFASGLASSIKAGIVALPQSTDGAMVVLGDMPGVTTAHLDRLLTSFRDAEGRAVVRAVHAGKRGNPVILPRSLFRAMTALEGDVGARHIVESGEAAIIDVEIGEAAALDVDTPEALVLAGGVPRG